MPKRDSSKVVYSTTDGDLRKARDPALRERLEGDGRVRVRRETKGRKGKGATTVSGVPIDDAALRELIRDAVWRKELKHGVNEPGFRRPERTMSQIGG